MGRTARRDVRISEEVTRHENLRKPEALAQAANRRGAGGPNGNDTQHEKPTDPMQLRNWLPAPEGSFHFAFRYYGPMSGLLDGSYDMPGIVRTG
jgi:hypothetical protein